MLGVINWTRLLVKRRPSQVLSTSSTDDGRQYITLSGHLCRSKLTCCEDRRALSKFYKSMQNSEHTVPEKSAFIFEDSRKVPLFLKIAEFPYNSMQDKSKPPSRVYLKPFPAYYNNGCSWGQTKFS